MSDSAIINDCIVHYDSRHIQVRKDYMDICVYDKSKFNQRVNSKGNRIKDEPNQECMAKILRLLETLTDDHRKEWFTRATKAKNKGLQVPEMPKEVYLELTYGGVCSLLYDTYGDSTVRNSVAVLLDRNFIKRRQKTNNSIPQYALNIEVVQAALIQREQDILSGVLKSTATKKHRKNKVAVENNSQASEINSQQPDFNSQASEINTNNIYSNNYLNKQDKKEENAHVSDDNAPTPSLSESNSPSSLQSIPPEESTPAQSDEQSSKQASSDSQSKDMPPAQETGKTSSGKGNKDSKPGTTTAKKPTPGAEEKALRRQVQKWIDEKRGYKLYGSATEKQIFAEQNAVSMFALKLLNEQQGNHEDGCTWEELDHLWKETRKDTYWGKPENIGRIGGYALQQQFTTIILGKYRKTKLKQMRNQNAAQGATQTGTNMASAVQEHRQLSDLERRNAELRAKYGQKQIS